MSYRQQITLVLDSKIPRYLRRPGFFNWVRWIFGSKPYLVLTLPNGDAVTHPDNASDVKQILEENLMDVHVRANLTAVKS
jgi:hypothetical protein